MVFARYHWPDTPKKTQDENHSALTAWSIVLIVTITVLMWIWPFSDFIVIWSVIKNLTTFPAIMPRMFLIVVKAIAVILTIYLGHRLYQRTFQEVAVAVPVGRSVQDREAHPRRTRGLFRSGPMQTTAESLDLNTYFRWTLILAAVIVPVSIVMFINTSISNDVGNLLKENDAAAIAMHEQLVNYQSALDQIARNPAEHPNQNGSPRNLAGVSQALAAPTLIEKLAQFARVSRQIFAESQVLNFFVFKAASAPSWANASEDVRRENLELNVRTGDTTDPTLSFPSVINEGFQKLAVYQDIRAFAKQTQQMNLLIYGAITAYVLPVAYSLLGACAFVLRNMAARTGIETYRPSYFNRTRLIIALIAGTVVGLFNNFTQGVSVSPLALAFLVGYAADVFFSFLDAFVHTFERLRDPERLARPVGTQSEREPPEIA